MGMPNLERATDTEVDQSLLIQLINFDPELVLHTHLEEYSAATRTKTRWLSGLIPEFIRNFKKLAPSTLSYQ